MISLEQLQTLVDLFAQPVEVDGQVQWHVPAWLAYLQQELGVEPMQSFNTLWKDSK